jgi:hypothetical protein
MPADPHLDLVRKLVALSLFNDSAAERISAHKKAVALIRKHGIGQGDLFATSSAAQWSIDDALRFSSKVRDILADPEVQKTAAAGRDLAKGVIDLFRKAKSK